MKDMTEGAFEAATKMAPMMLNDQLRNDPEPTAKKSSYDMDAIDMEYVSTALLPEDF